MPDFMSLRGPIEKEDGKLVLRIPLEAGGDDLVVCAKGISQIDGDHLVVTIPDWLAEKLELYEGRHVSVDNENGKFNIRVIPVAVQ